MANVARQPPGGRTIPLLRSSAGIDWYWRDEEGQGATAFAVQDVAPILEQNKAMATHNDGYTSSRDMARIASIPLAIVYKWLTEEGWDAFSPDPDCQKKLAAKLDSSDFRYLRTSELIVGDHWRHSI